MTVPVGVFVSGSGTNLQALLDFEQARPDSEWRVATVIADREAYGLERAGAAGREAHLIPVSGRDAAEVASDTLAVLHEAEVRLLVLAGYLRLIPERVVSEYSGRILNTHPSLLPAFGGRGMYGSRVHEAVLASGATVSGVTVHTVDEEYDSGSIVAQWPVPVMPGDDAGSLGARVLAVEHVLYPRVVDHYARAIAVGQTPGPFTPPGSGYTQAHGVPGDELARLIESGFRST